MITYTGFEKKFLLDTTCLLTFPPDQSNQLNLLLGLVQTHLFSIQKNGFETNWWTVYDSFISATVSTALIELRHRSFWRTWQQCDCHLTVEWKDKVLLLHLRLTEANRTSIHTDTLIPVTTLHWSIQHTLKVLRRTFPPYGKKEKERLTLCLRYRPRTRW